MTKIFRKSKIRHASIFLVIGIIVLSLVSIGLFYHRIRVGRALAYKAFPYSREDVVSGPSLLILGDSLGVGVGATRPEFTIAGRIGRSFPLLRIVNRSISGARIEDLAFLLEQVDDHFDVILIQGGGNDIVRFTSPEKLHDDISWLLENAIEKGDNVVWISTGNLGFVPAFPYPLGVVYSHRTQQIRDLFISRADAYGVVYIDLFREEKDDLFTQNPDLYYARDLFHPSDEGYELWYTMIRDVFEEYGLDEVLQGIHF